MAEGCGVLLLPSEARSHHLIILTLGSSFQVPDVLNEDNRSARPTGF